MYDLVKLEGFVSLLDLCLSHFPFLLTTGKFLRDSIKTEFAEHGFLLLIKLSRHKHYTYKHTHKIYTYINTCAKILALILKLYLPSPLLIVAKEV